jgi:hypothetical protein
VLGAADDLILELFYQIAEVVAVPGDADDEVPVVVGLLLRAPERVGVDHVELNVVSVEPDVGSETLAIFVEAVWRSISSRSSLSSAIMTVSSIVESFVGTKTAKT